jgi:LPXTG-motif cell wall-anchored protein
MNVDARRCRHALGRGAGGAGRLKPHARGIRLNMLALIAYRSYHGATTVWAFIVAILIVLVAGWYIRRRR